MYWLDGGRGRAATSRRHVSKECGHHPLSSPMVKTDEFLWRCHEIIHMLAHPCLKDGRDDSRILSLVVKLTAYRKMAFRYSLSLHILNTLYAEPFRLPWTRAFPTDAARPGCLPEASRSSSACQMLASSPWQPAFPLVGAGAAEGEVPGWRPALSRSYNCS